jgi:hypothetical protein
MWRMFTAALLASVTLAFLRAGIYSGDISVSGLLSFSNLHEALFSLAASSVASPIYWWEIFLFAAVGAAGGVLGAVFNKCVLFLSYMRPQVCQCK